MDFVTLEQCIFEKADIARVEKLRSIKSPVGYYDNVRKFTKRVCSDHSIHRWQHLAEIREKEIENGYMI